MACRVDPVGERAWIASPCAQSVAEDAKQVLLHRESAMLLGYRRCLQTFFAVMAMMPSVRKLVAGAVTSSLTKVTAQVAEEATSSMAEAAMMAFVAAA